GMNMKPPKRTTSNVYSPELHERAEVRRRRVPAEREEGPQRTLAGRRYFQEARDGDVRSVARLLRCEHDDIWLQHGGCRRRRQAEYALGGRSLRRACVRSSDQPRHAMEEVALRSVRCEVPRRRSLQSQLHGALLA